MSEAARAARACDQFVFQCFGGMVIPGHGVRREGRFGLGDEQASTLRPSPVEWFFLEGLRVMNHRLDAVASDPAPAHLHLLSIDSRAHDY